MTLPGPPSIGSVDVIGRTAGLLPVRASVHPAAGWQQTLHRTALAAAPFPGDDNP